MSPRIRVLFAIGRKLGLAKIRAMPRCGARAKRSGTPCQKPALANGRCRYHGGKTPRGADWHKPQVANAAGNVAKAEGKLRSLEKRRRAREARLAAMTSEQRTRHDAWHRKYRPGSADVRAKARSEQESAKLVRDLLAQCEPTPDREAAALQDKIEAARRRLADLETKMTEGGIFE